MTTVQAAATIEIEKNDQQRQNSLAITTQLKEHSLDLNDGNQSTGSGSITFVVPKKYIDSTKELLNKYVGENYTAKLESKDYAITLKKGFSINTNIPFVKDYKLKSEDPTINISADPFGLKFSGKYQLFKDGKEKGILDLSGNNNYIEYFPPNKIDFFGSLAIKDVNIVPGLLKLDELAFKRGGDVLSGRVAASLPKLGVDVSGEAELVKGELNKFQGEFSGKTGADRSRIGV